MATGQSSLYFFRIIQRDPASAGLQFAPTLRTALTACLIHNGKDALTCELSGLAVISSGACANIEIGNSHLHFVGSFAVPTSRGGCFLSGINLIPALIEHGIASIAVRAVLRIFQDAESALLRFGIRPAFTHSIKRAFVFR